MNLFLKHKKKIIALVLVLFSYLAFDYVYPSGTWRYRITVEVETPEGIRSGSAVREVYVSTPILNLPEVHPHTKVKGEAVVIDLGERGTLFVLKNWDSYYEVFKAFPIPYGGGGTTVRGIKYYRSLKPGKKAELKTKHPKMVRFETPNDPKTVKLVKGNRWNKATQKSDAIDDFEAIFGAGVKLKNVTIEITDDPVTRIVNKKYPSYQNIWPVLPRAHL